MEQLIETVQPLGQTTSYMRDAYGNIIRQNEPGGQTVRMTYDNAGNLLTIQDAGGNQVSYTYGADGTILSEDLGMGPVKTYTYSPDRKITKRCNGRGQELVFRYNKAGNMIEADGTIISYDANGNVLTVKDDSGTTTYRTYDALNRVTSFTDVHGKTIRYTYEVRGNLESIQYPGGKTVHYVYDEANRLSEVRDYAGRITRYTYDCNGRLVKTIYPNGIVEYRTYDMAGRIVLSNVESQGKTISQQSYVYDANSTIIEEQIDDVKLTLHYDEVDRLISVKSEGGRNETYTYDVSGNITSARGSDNTDRFMNYGKGNRISTWNNQSVLHDEDGNITWAPLGEGFQSFEYNAYDKLLRAGRTEYLYDAEGTRIGQKQGIDEVTYITDPTMELSRLLIEQRWNSETYYVYGHGLISQETITGNQKRYRLYHYDYRGSTIMMTDESGQITDTMRYDAYGSLTARTGKTCTPFLYVGKYGVQTDLNGLLYMRARYFHPQICRFLSVDKGKDGFNWYQYVCGNPIMAIDPFGLDSYVFYDPQIYNSIDIPFWRTGDKYANQLAKDLKNHYGGDVKLVSVQTAEQFYEEWNKIDDTEKVDAVVLDFHAGANNLQIHGQEKMYQPEIEKLMPKSIENLILITCNTSNTPTEGSISKFNPANTFSNNCLINYVISPDGSVDNSLQRVSGWQDWKEYEYILTTWMSPHWEDYKGNQTKNTGYGVHTEGKREGLLEGQKQVSVNGGKDNGYRNSFPELLTLIDEYKK